MRNRILLVPTVAAFLVMRSLAQEPAPVPSPPSETPALEGVAPGGLAPRGNGRIWFEADAQMAWLKGMRLPPLVTTSPAGTAQASAGLLGLSSTTVLFGAERVDGDLRGGVKFDLGYWIDPEGGLAIDAGYGVLEGQGAIFNATSTGGAPILARPFVDANTGRDQALLVGFPGVSSGSLAVNAVSSNFQDGHVDFRQRYSLTDNLRLDALFGYRYFRYDENLIVFENLQPTGSSFAPGTVVVGNDRFGTKNQFNGGEIGLVATYLFDRLSLEMLAKLAVGNMDRQVNIIGAQVISVPNTTPSVFASNFLALSSNSGLHGSEDWMAIPEFGLNLAYRLRDNMKVRLGYSFIYLPELARAGDQVNLAVNQTLLPNNGPQSGPNEPAFVLRRTDLWVQTVNLGFEISY
jgi:hypothetical protein